MTVPRASGRTFARVGGALALLAVSGCLDLGLVGDVAFAPRVPGLPADQPWVSMPVGAWLTGSGVEPRAISACFAEACQPRAVVALFRAEGAEARALARVLDDPAALSRAVAGRRRPGARPVPPGRAADVTVERRQEGPLSGVAIRLARRDGSRPAYGYALAARRGDALAGLLVVAETEDGARRLAREAAPPVP